MAYNASLTSMDTHPSRNQPVRSFNTTFQPSTDKMCFVTYSIRIQTTLTLTSGQAGLVQLLIDSFSPPTTVVAQGRSGTTGTLSLTLTHNDDYTVVLSGWVLPGNYVRINTTNVTGTPTFTLERSTEYQF